MFDIFADIEPIEMTKIKQSEFNDKALKIFEQLDAKFSKCWHSRLLKDEEYPDENICDECVGCGTFKVNGEVKECFQDKENGECYHRFMDAEEFGVEVEMELGNIWELLGNDIVPDSTNIT